MTAHSPPPPHDWVVLKFGGTSVSDLAAWEHIAAIAKQYRSQNEQLLIVCSAPQNISNSLEQLLQDAIRQQQASVLKKIESVYRRLAIALNLEFDQLLHNDFTALRQWVEGIALIGESTLRTQAKVMALGELMLSALGTAYLQTQGIHVHSIDARHFLQVTSSGHGSQHTHHHYLRGQCDSQFDATVLERFAALQAPVLMTQGFIAADEAGDTVLLGRGGSDTSAAYFAAKINAKRCEIWTDVPGIYTANPRDIPQARLLRQLDYDEAQEIASMGATVLHPQCIAPLKANHIPLHIKYTRQPNKMGTVISIDRDEHCFPIKSISKKYGITLITIESLAMWQQAGFLAAVFQCFKQHGISIDLITTSQASVTLSLDTSHMSVDAQIIQLLLKDLNAFAKANVISPCATISLVGHDIRAVLHQLGGVFALFESQQVHLLSQSANDLNLTFVVDEDQAQRLAQRLHALLIEQTAMSHYLVQDKAFKSLEQEEQTWWRQQSRALLKIAETQSPVFVYSQHNLAEASAALKNCRALDKIFYSVKANPHRSILHYFHQAGLGFECVSLQEVEYILRLFPNIDHQRIVFTPNFAPRAEYQQALSLNIHVTVDSLYPLTHWPELFAQHRILLRIDPGQGYGHHQYVTTGGNESKFGIALDTLKQAIDIAKQHQITLYGLHVHSGSGILDLQVWKQTLAFLTTLLDDFPTVRVFNLGGGLGVVEQLGQQALDLAAFNTVLHEAKSAFPHIQLWLEPGRFLVARAGVLLAKVTQVKQKGDVRFVGIETGMNSLVRPALYGAYHEIVNLSRLDAEKTQVANIVGPICESGDTLGYARLLPDTGEGDCLLIANTGAYGRCMSSSYNLREPAAEYFME